MRQGQLHDVIVDTNQLMSKKYFSRKTGSPVLRVMQLISLACILFIGLFGLDSDAKPFSVFIILLLNLYMMYASRKNILMFFISLVIAYSNYSILYANFINLINTSYFTSVISPTVSSISLNILLCFNCFLMLFVRWDRIKDAHEIKFIRPKQGNILIYYLLIFILVVVFFIGFSRPTVLGERGIPKPIYEYSLSFFILLFYYFGKWSFGRRLGLAIVLCYALQNFIFGGRILGIQFLLCAYIMLYIKKIPTKVVILLVIFFLVLLSLIGSFRAELLYTDLSFKGIVSILSGHGLALDTAYSAYFCSESFVYCHDVIPFSERFFLFCQFLKGVFLSIKPEYVLQNVTDSYIKHYGGGIIPHYFYFYLGTIGVLLSGVLVSLYLNLVINLTSNSKGLIKCVGVFVVCNTFRWYLYTPLGLLKGVLFLVIVYYSFQFVNSILGERHKTMKKNNSRERSLSSV